MKSYCFITINRSSINLIFITRRRGSQENFRRFKGEIYIVQHKNENKIEIQEILNIFDHLSHPNVFYKTAPFTPKPEEIN